ncbi:MAG: DNA repair protein RecN [Clostridia bacterium]|nr:DNA repair protein RecN [Clostridia bacterium]
MIEAIHIENVALIESLDIAFSEGMNVLTGETGAGKSIIIDSIGMLLGGRAQRELIRTGKKSAFVSAIISGIPEAVISDMSEAGVSLDEDGRLFVEREIFADGKNTVRINSRPTTVSTLKSVMSDIVNIHGQHDASGLLENKRHLSLLDRFAGDTQTQADYSEKYKRFHELSREFSSLDTDEREKAAKVDYLKFCIDEIEAAQLTPGEDEELAARKKKISNAKKFISAIDAAYDLLYGGEKNETSAYNAVYEAKNELLIPARDDDELLEYARRLESVSLEIEDIAMSVASKKDEFDFSDEEIDEIIARQDEISRLKRKYAGSIEDILKYLDECKAQLDDIVFADAKRERLRGELKAAEGELRTAAERLTAQRQKAARRLETGITKKLSYLDMSKVRFKVDIKTGESPERFTPRGADSVEFLISPNPGEDLKPLSKIASGGELSRIMLAMINVLFDSEPTGTLVFDEIDAGISGRAAVKVANALYETAGYKQVLCVTHLSQLALMADCHFYIEKSTDGKTTKTNVHELSSEERLHEIARITGGDRITTVSLVNAEEMLSMAQRTKEEIRKTKN